MNFLLALFGCPHQNLSRVFTFRKRDTYQVCLDCGREFEYSLEAMQIIEERPVRVLAPDPVAQARALVVGKRSGSVVETL